MEDRTIITQNTNGKLNGFLIFIFIVGIIRTVLNCIFEIMNYSIYNDKYFEVFCTAVIVFAAIHIFGFIYTLLKKTLWGICIIFGNIIFSIIIVFVLNGIFDYDIFETQTIIFNLIQLIIIPLLLMLRKNGESAWSVLKRNTREIQIINLLNKHKLSFRRKFNKLQGIDYKVMLIVWTIISVIACGVFYITHDYNTHYDTYYNKSNYDENGYYTPNYRTFKFNERNTGLEISVIISLLGFVLISGFGYINNKKRKELMDNDKLTERRIRSE